MMMWDLLINDIKLIVCRFVHKDRCKQLIQEYNKKFGKYWDDYCEEFTNGGDMAINYRELATHQSACIYSFYEDPRPYRLSPNYKHAIIWCPTISTHEPWVNPKNNDNEL